MLPFNKTQLTKLFVKTQEQASKTLTEETKENNRNLKSLFEITKSEITVVIKVNDTLVKQLSSVKASVLEKRLVVFPLRMCRGSEMPSLIQHDQLESTVCRILQHIGVNITENKKRLATDTAKRTTGPSQNFPAENIASTQCVSKNN